MRKSIFAKSALGLFAATAVCTPITATAGAELSAGVWWVYQNVTNSDFNATSFNEDLDNETGGNFADPALILYADDDGSHGPWHFSAETRIGTGSFTSPANNNSGDNFTLHKAWIGYDLTEDASLKLGKSQVPFGWKTVNFWPGDGLQGGYGDQMDVGLKLSGDAGAIHYDAAYYHQDDWGEDSTDTVDDNGHWGSSATYRKIKTGVVNVDWNFLEHHTVGASAQYGRMQDLVPVANGNPSASNDEGTHQAYDLHYMFEMDNWSAKYRFISVERDFDGMDALLASADAPVDNKIENQRHVVEVGYNHNDWFYYVDAGVASTDTTGNDADDVQFIAPGIRYQYGPGWIYFEYLQSDGDINAYGDVYESDFDAAYVAFDFYF
ncbi:MAG: hypothetical protein ABJF95_14140 [Marinobacter sp.]|jgi:hypothetical protein|uniref:hypothetical protein n=1 Tax=Marinobacter sp. TaxID=50741 RepID=UPI0032664859